MSTPRTSTPFSPRVTPRPAYPPFGGVLLRWACVLGRDAFWGCALCYALLPFYAAASASFSLRAFYCLTMCTAHTGSYILFNGGLALLEWLEFGPLLRCKIPRKKAELPSGDLLRQLLKEASINHFISSPLTSYAIFTVAVSLGMPLPSAPLPSPERLALLFVAAHTFNDFGFYWTHRMLHSKLLYGRFHKQHHSFRGSVSAAAEFAGPFEVVVSNQLPTVGLLLLLGCHPLVQAAWIVLRLLQTYEVHSGYDFKGTWLSRLGVLCSDSTAHHDHHHTANVGNFGAEHTDWLFGTMDHFLVAGGPEGYVAQRRAADLAGKAFKQDTSLPDLTFPDLAPAAERRS